MVHSLRAISIWFAFFYKLLQLVLCLLFVLFLQVFALCCCVGLGGVNAKLSTLGNLANTTWLSVLVVDFRYGCLMSVHCAFQAMDLLFPPFLKLLIFGNQPQNLRQNETTSVLLTQVLAMVNFTKGRDSLNLSILCESMDHPISKNIKNHRNPTFLSKDMSG